MDFLSKVGGILRQTVSKQVDSHLAPSSHSIFQAIRWLSSSKVFIGGVMQILLCCFICWIGHQLTWFFVSLMVNAGLSYSTDDTSLHEAFSQYGNVVDGTIPLLLYFLLICFLVLAKWLCGIPLGCCCQSYCQGYCQSYAKRALCHSKSFVF